MTMARNLRRILSCMSWCIIIVALLGVSVFCIVYVINVVHEACHAVIWSQQQEDEKTMRMLEQQ